MERPNIKDYFSEKADVNTVHNEYINSPHLYSYSSALDRYVDHLEDKLKEPKELIIDDVVSRSKHLKAFISTYNEEMYKIDQHYSIPYEFVDDYLKTT